MQRAVSICLMVHWAVIFAVMALTASDGLGFPAIAGATGHLLVCALFLWAAATLFAGESHGQGRADPVGLAFAGAILTLAVAIAIEAANATGGPASSGVLLAGLAASYLVATRPLVEDGQPAVSAAARRSRHVARRKAAHAAHGSMLDRLSGRGPTPWEGDA